jgi:hypothetical protein
VFNAGGAPICGIPIPIYVTDCTNVGIVLDRAKILLVPIPFAHYGG